ncbi:MAG: hypothetical protein V1850_01320 [Candidatus Bathyarchaeota archaeon]
MKLSVTFNHIQAEREDSKDLSRDATIEYPVDMYIQEVKKEGSNRTVISFRLQTKTSPEIASFSLAGNLLLEGTEDEIDVLTTPSAKGPPQIWKYVYQESMNILTVLANVIDIPFPTPKIGGEIAVDARNYV